MQKRLSLHVAISLILPFAAIAFAVPSSALAQNSQQQVSGTAEHGKKLILKDGSFERVSSYEVQGDRVRYFSLDRSEWEEIPSAQVDWTATKSAEAQEEKQEAALTNKVKADEEAARMAPLDVDASLEVLPGVFLPPGEGFFILDGHAIFSLKQSEATAKNSKGQMVKRIVVPIPIIPARTSIDLAGRRATFRITNPTPEFYFRTTEQAEPQIELIRAKVEGDKRHIENIDSLFGERSDKGKTVSLQIWQVAKGIYRFTLGQSLAPGEYALAQFDPKEGIDLELWDFGVDAAPKNSDSGKRNQF